ncbi:unnamed protein product [Rotaria sp. Silwood1]|nr:unnamed protein product [Rotaria sp. Silwood1]
MASDDLSLNEYDASLIRRFLGNDDKFFWCAHECGFGHNEIQNIESKLPEQIQDLYTTIKIIIACRDPTKQTLLPEAFFQQSNDILGNNFKLNQDDYNKSNNHFNTNADQDLINLMHNDRSLNDSFSKFIQNLPKETQSNAAFYKNYLSLSNIPSDSIQIRSQFFYILKKFIEKSLPIVDLSLPLRQSFFTDQIRIIKSYLLSSTKFQLLAKSLEKTEVEYNGDWNIVNFDIIKANSNSDNSENTMLYQAYQQLHTNAHITFRRSNEQLWHAQYIGMHSTDHGRLYRDSITRIYSDICSSRLSLFILYPNGRMNSDLNRDCWIPNVFPPNKSISNKYKTLSFCWTIIWHQVRVWMDVKGGMEEHLLDSMAAAVQNSAVVVCFLTQKYQDSQNCKEEFKYARKKNKPTIPCLIEAGWKPEGWLDMGVSDLLYIDFNKIKENSSNFEDKCEELLKKIKQLAKTNDYFRTEDEDEASIDNQEDDGTAVEPTDEPNYDVTSADYASKLSPNIREGPEIETTSFDPSTINKDLCEGDSVVRLMRTGSVKDRKIYANQELFAHDGKFLNYFFIPKLVFQNTSKEPISVIEITSEYQNSEGNWLDCYGVKIGPAISDESESYTWLPDTTLNLEPSKLVTYALRVDVQIHGEPGLNNQRRARAHSILPQPFKIRLHVHDTEGKTVSLLVEQINDPLILPTKARIVKQFDYEDVVAFIYADDCNTNTRYWVIVHYEDKSKLRFSYGNCLHGSTTKYLDTWLISELCNQAKQTDTTEIVLDDWNDNERTITALFDKITFILFAMRIELKTPTSRTVETVLLPLDKIKERFVIVKQEPEVYRPLGTTAFVSGGDFSQTDD